MRRHFSRFLSFVLLGVLGLCGCQAICGPQGIPEDPLYYGKKPKESPAVNASPVNVASNEPRMPSEPAVKTRAALTNRVNVPARLTSETKSVSQE